MKEGVARYRLRLKGSLGSTRDNTRPVGDPLHPCLVALSPLTIAIALYKTSLMKIPLKNIMECITTAGNWATGTRVTNAAEVG